jgi:hypothetical protein
MIVASSNGGLLRDALALPASDHARDAAFAARQVRFRLNLAAQQLARGNCQAALGAIGDALERYGTLLAHRRAAGLPLQDDSTKVLITDLAKLKVKAQKRCVRG